MGVDTKWLADRIKQLAAINEALIAERDQAWKRAAHAEEMWGELEASGLANRVAIMRLEAKLAKAVEVALEECPFRWGTPNYDNWWRDRRTTIAELTGGKDE